MPVLIDLAGDEFWKALHAVIWCSKFSKKANDRAKRGLSPVVRIIITAYIYFL
jgi:hypothetical protein